MGRGIQRAKHRKVTGRISAVRHPAVRFNFKADFSQFVVTTANETACETSRDKSRTFPRSPARFTPPGYGCLLDFAAFCPLIRQCRLVIEFLFVGPQFRYGFFPLHLTVQSLPVAIGFVGNYALWDFHPSFGTCLSYRKSPGAGIASGPGKAERRIVFALVPNDVCEADHDPRRVFFQTLTGLLSLLFIPDGICSNSRNIH